MGFRTGVGPLERENHDTAAAQPEVFPTVELLAVLLD
jgi:hypothetical protein